MFEIPLAVLEPKDVEDFLASAPGEGLVWEGKGTDSLTRLKTKIIAGVCGLANQLGGRFIIGAVEDKASGTWSLEGVDDDVNEDAHDWLARILTANLKEPPPFEIRRWSLSNGRLAAVIQVDASSTPPCMTRSGLVYQRVVGETKKITDPSVLADLIRKGQARRDAVEARAVDTIRRLIDVRALVGDVQSIRVVLALVPTTGRDDYSGRLFTESFKGELVLAASELEKGPGDEWAEDEAAPHRDGYVIRRGTNQPGRWQWGLQASWSGAMIVEFATPAVTGDGPYPPPVDWIVAKAWRAAAAPLSSLTGIPDKEHVPAALALGMTGGFHVHIPGR